MESTRKLNKLKKLLGDEVSPHITSPLRIEKPLPQLPPARQLERSDTAFTIPPMMGSSKRYNKKEVMRPSTAREQGERNERHLMEFALAGSSSTLRPSTASPVQKKGLGRGFWDMYD